MNHSHPINILHLPVSNPTSINGVGLRTMPSFRNRFVLVDGTNLIRLARGGEPHLTTLLSVTVAMASYVQDFICVFDANTPYLLKREPQEATAYHELIARFSEFFVEVTGGTRADDVILPEAEERNALIVSRDRYRDYADQYPWLLSMNRLVFINQIHSQIRLGAFACRCPRMFKTPAW